MRRETSQLTESAHKELTARWLRITFHFPGGNPSNRENLPDENDDPPYTVPKQLDLAPNAPTARHGPIGNCIYCGTHEFEPGTGIKLSEEHIVPEGLGARLVLTEASCKSCADRINKFETNILGTLLWTPRRKLNLRVKRRKRTEVDYPVTVEINGKDQVIRLPLDHHPTVLMLPYLNAPGILCGRAEGDHGIQGMFIHELNDLNQMPRRGFNRFSSATMDTVALCQLLAKIAHGFAVYSWGLGSFEPLLTEFIRREFGKKENWPQCYHLVGGNPSYYRANDALHVLGWGITPTDGIDYLVVAIRLFANFASPVFHVVVGRPTAAMQIRPNPSEGEALGRLPDKLHEPPP